MIHEDWGEGMRNETVGRVWEGGMVSGADVLKFLYDKRHSLDLLGFLFPVP